MLYSLVHAQTLGHVEGEESEAKICVRKPSGSEGQGIVEYLQRRRRQEKWTDLTSDLKIHRKTNK